MSAYIDCPPTVSLSEDEADWLQAFAAELPAGYAVHFERYDQVAKKGVPFSNGVVLDNRKDGEAQRRTGMKVPFSNGWWPEPKRAARQMLARLEKMTELNQNEFYTWMRALKRWDDDEGYILV